ncbi:MAG: MarR family transcriptional regulator [Eubacterium sp.]|nr:MarR family transcriptional regulator [Eubacterium sp.]
MEYLGYRFKIIDKLFKIRMNKRLEKYNITEAQMCVLFYLDHHENEKITQKVLAQEFSIKHSTMSGILQRLEEKGYIEITVDEENKRFKNIRKTELVQSFHDEMHHHRDETEKILLNGFNEEEKERLRTYLDRIYHNLMEHTDLSEEEMKCFERREK